MKAVLARILIATVASLVFVGFIGLVSIRAESVESGLVLNWDNTPRSASVAGAAWIQHGAIALVSAGLLLFMWHFSAGVTSSRRIVLPVASAITIFSVSVGFLAMTTYPYLSPVQGSLSADGAGPDSVPLVLSWWQNGALNPATHVVGAASLALAVMLWRTSAAGHGLPTGSPAAEDGAGR